MKGLLALLCCLAATSGFVLREDDYDTQWKAWRAFYKKSYATETEENARRGIWRDNLKVKKLRQNPVIIIVLVFKVAKELSDGANYEQHDEKKNLG